MTPTKRLVVLGEDVEEPLPGQRRPGRIAPGQARDAPLVLGPRPES